MADKQPDLKDEYLGALLVIADSTEFKIYQRILDQQIEVRKKALADLIVFDQKTMAEQNVLHGEIQGLTTAKLIPTHAKAKVDDNRFIEEAFNNHKQKDEDK